MAGTPKRKSSSPQGAASGSSPPSPEAKQPSERKTPTTVKRESVKSKGSPPPFCSVHGPNCPGGHKNKR